MKKKLLITSVLFAFICINTVNASITKKNNSNTVYVDIKGAVKSPGVYQVSKNARVIDVIKKAGNLKENADTSIINLSKKVKDEMYIIIYTKEEVSTYKDKIIPSTKIVKEIEEKIICPDTDNDACINKDNNSIDSSKININTASIDELASLKGVGENKAKKIIEYREKNNFEKIEDILNVPGIGNSIYEKIKDNIEV